MAGVETRTQDPGFSLSKVVEDVSQHGYAQTEALKDHERTLQSLNASLLDVENKCKMAETQLRSKVRLLLTLESDMEHLEQQTRVLFDECTAISQDNTQLGGCIRAKEQGASSALEMYNSHRKKMADYRAAVLIAATRTEAHKELVEKRAHVKMLKQKKEELKDDLANPNGSNVQMAKIEISALKEHIIVKKKTVAEKRAKLQKESETHIQKKKDIEIQNKRYEAIVKRLHCQLSKAQAVHRQTSADIYHMERQIAELKRQLETSQGSVVSA